MQIFYDPKKVNYAMLLEIFWRSVDPTDDGGQFCDRGESYKTAIFANSLEQKRLADDSKRKLQLSAVLNQPIVTSIDVARPFYPAEGSVLQCIKLTLHAHISVPSEPIGDMAWHPGKTRAVRPHEHLFLYFPETFGAP